MWGRMVSTRMTQDFLQFQWRDAWKSGCCVRPERPPLCCSACYMLLCKRHISCCWDEVWQGQDYAESMVGLPTRVHRKPSTSSYDSCSSCSEQRNEGFNRMHVSTQVKSTSHHVLTVLMLGLQQTKKTRIGWSKRTAIAKQNAGLPHLSQPKPLLSLVASGGTTQVWQLLGLWQWTWRQVAASWDPRMGSHQETFGTGGLS